MTLASVEYGVMKRRPIMNTSRRCRPTQPETTPHTMLNLIHLNLKNTSQKASA